MSRFSALALLALAACDGGTYQFQGETMSDYFTFDGERQWTFVNSENSDYLRVVDLDTATETSSDGRTIYTLIHTVECMTGRNAPPDSGDTETDTGSTDTGDTDEPSEYCGDVYDGQVLLKARISQSRSDGVHWWGYETPAGGVVQFTEPVLFSEDPWLVGSSETTETDGYTWTTTFESIGDCAVQWNSNWDGCPHIVLEDGGQGTPLAGTYQVQAGYAIVAMDFEDEDGVWELLNATWERE